MSRSGSPIDMHVKQQLHAFMDHSNVEKNELTKLNEKFSCYVDKVKRLENENIKLMGDIGNAQAHWGDETRQIREHYEPNLFDVRTKIDDVANLKTIADVRTKRCQYENNEFQRRLGDNLKLSNADKTRIKNLEVELAQTKEKNELMKKSIDDELAEIEKYRTNRDDTWSQLVELLDKLDDELYRRISVEYNNQTLREHIEFIKEINEKELLEMSQLSDALPFSDQMEFYKEQLKKVIGNIRKDYEQLHMEQTRELEEWMKLKSEELAAKVNEKDALYELEMEMQLENIESLRNTFESNNNQLDDLKQQNALMSKKLEAVENRVELERVHLNEKLEAQSEEAAKLNDDLNNLIEDYNHLNSNRANLEYEMQVYKRLLDSQFDRLNSSDAKPAIKSSSSSPLPPPPAPAPAPLPAPALVAQQQHHHHVQITTEIKNNQTSVTSNAFGGKVQNKKEKKGSVGISDSSPDGKYIVIENTGSNSSVTDVSGWQIRRKVDGNEVLYTFPSGVCLAPEGQLVIWASTYAGQSKSACDLVTEFENWGIGINSLSRLMSSNGEEKSLFHQQITFSSHF